MAFSLAAAAAAAALGSADWLPWLQAPPLPPPMDGVGSEGRGAWEEEGGGGRGAEDELPSAFWSHLDLRCFLGGGSPALLTYKSSSGRRWRGEGGGGRGEGWGERGGGRGERVMGGGVKEGRDGGGEREGIRVVEIEITAGHWPFSVCISPKWQPKYQH